MKFLLKERKIFIYQNEIVFDFIYNVLNSFGELLQKYFYQIENNSNVILSHLIFDLKYIETKSLNVSESRNDYFPDIEYPITKEKIQCATVRNDLKPTSLSSLSLYLIS